MWTSELSVLNYTFCLPEKHCSHGTLHTSLFIKSSRKSKKDIQDSHLTDCK